ncbi:MAG TPA: polyphosphate kinase 1 [Verrucomicrobiae bacterium]|nr:polyphosphate kinase 1 [Verrucomicrobiae bacterium]
MGKTGDLYLNRELSWLEFNRRVLGEATDASVPLLERLKFLSITSSNLDEFFMVRVGGLQQLLNMGKNVFDPAGMTTREQLVEISRRARALVAEQYACFLDDIEPKLAIAGIRRLRVTEIETEYVEYLERLFDREIYPIVTPRAVESADEFVSLTGLGLDLLARLKPLKAHSRKPRFAVITLPKRLSRFITVPIRQDGYDYALLEDVVALFKESLFPGEVVVECVPFRLTRNADLILREDLAGDLLSQMREVLDARKRSGCVRLEVGDNISAPSLSFLKHALDVSDDQVYAIPGPPDLAAYREIAGRVGYAKLNYEPWPGQASPCVAPSESMFEAISRRDILLCHPYESFEPVVRLLEQAAEDPEVLAIKQILYRTSGNSPIVAALARAADKGKHVTAVVELKARFDEERNIDWAKALELSGVQIVYGLRRLKVHAKICIVVRREATGIRRYVHFGTGNYNEVTARLYSDVSLMTCNEDFGADATQFFNTITAYSQPIKYRRIEAAPLGLRAKLLGLIESEAQRCKQGQTGHIMAKLNSLVDADVIQALYTASQQGVRIQLNVRGVCCLRPGVPRLSDNIEVVSIVDRYLEHSRLLYFHHGGEPLVFISSADWMPRNLDRRVELLVPVQDAANQERLISILQTTFQDNVKSRRLMPDGSYQRLMPAAGAKPLRSQQVFFEQAREAAKQAQTGRYQTFVPQFPAARPSSTS